MNTYMSTPGNSEDRNHTQQHTDSTKLTVPGWDRTNNALVSIVLSERISQPFNDQSGIKGLDTVEKDVIRHFSLMTFFHNRLIF